MCNWMLFVLSSYEHCSVLVRFQWRRHEQKLPQSQDVTLFVVNWYLHEQIEIYRLMLYREEFFPADPSACLHCGPLLRKIEILQQELANSEDQQAA